MLASLTLPAIACEAAIDVSATSHLRQEQVFHTAQLDGNPEPGPDELIADAPSPPWS